MTRRDPPDPHGQPGDEDAERLEDSRPAPSNVVDLGTDVGTEPPTGLPPDEPGTSEPPSPDRGEWEVVDETGGRPPDPRCGSDTTPPLPAAGPSDSASASDEYVARTYRSNDALAVVAELPGVSEPDLSTGIDVRSNHLVISVEGRTVDRIPLPWCSITVAAIRFEDGVLEARLEPADEGGFGANRERFV